MTTPKKSPDLIDPVESAPSAMLAENAKLRATNARLRAALARYEAPLAERYERLKNAATDTGVSRQTLMRWAKAGLVKHRFSAGNIEIDVIDAVRERFDLAPDVARNGPRR
jgi:hypothetical protein